MATQFFDNKLENHKLFKDLKDCIDCEDKSENLRNLLELKDDVMYVWNPVENCVMTLNINYLEEHEDNQTYQKLFVLSPPPFTIERVVAGACGTRLCLVGSRGVVIMELPSKWGRGGLFDGGKETILCKSYPLDERFLYTLGDVRRLHWHPTSLSHILVLTSDNTIRLYNIGLKHGPKLARIITIGPKPAGLIAGRGILDALGDTAVDFTPIPETTYLLILRGDGNVYIADCDLSLTSSSQSVTGPLSMYPPADDNYGAESCSITVLAANNSPPLVVIATCSTILYHCLLLPDPNGELDQSISEVSETSYALYVMEAVELSVNLTDDEVVHHSYPVHLYPCPGISGTYVCVHAAGVHSVTLPIIGQIKDFMLADEGSLEEALSEISRQQSLARYLVCARSSGVVTAAGGVAVLCADGRMLWRFLEPHITEEELYKEIKIKNPSLDDQEIHNVFKEKQRMSFTTIIQELLTREVSQPLFNINKKEEPSSKEALEFVTQATLKLRQEYITRQDRALSTIVKKIAGLRSLNDQQMQWQTDLKKEIDDAELHSAVLKDKCALAEKHQDDLKYRCSALIRAIRSNSSSSPEERQLLNELVQLQRTQDIYTEQIDRLKARADANDVQKKTWQEEYKKKDIALGRSHSATISSILQQQTSQISNLIDEAKLLKENLNIV